MFGFIARIIGRILFYCFALPLVIIAAFAAAGFTGNDVYNYQGTQSLLREMDAAGATSAGSWTAANGNIGLITGTLTSNGMSDRVTDAAPQLAQCAALQVTVTERWRGRRGRTSTRELMDEVHVANNLRVGGYAIDPAFLQLHDLGITEVEHARHSRLGFLCDGATDGRSCEIKTICLTSQPVSIMGNVMGTKAEPMLVYPEQLNDDELPLLQLGAQTPPEFARTFTQRFSMLGPVNIIYSTIGFLTVVLFIKRVRMKMFALLAATAALLWLPYALLDLAEVAYAPLVLFLFAALYFARSLVTSLAPFAEGLAKTSATSMPESVYITPNYLASSAVPLAADSSYDDMIAPALAHLKTRLSPLTLTALSPEQLEKTVAMNIETHAYERWKTLTELQRHGLVAKVIVALKKK